MPIKILNSSSDTANIFNFLLFEALPFYHVFENVVYQQSFIYTLANYGN